MTSAGLWHVIEEIYLFIIQNAHKGNIYLQEHFSKLKIIHVNAENIINCLKKYNKMPARKHSNAFS